MDFNPDYPFYGSLDKEAGIGDYLGAARQGADIASGGSWLRHPIEALKGAYRGVVGHEMGKQTDGLQQQGIRFNKDPYGRIQDVNIGDTIKNYAGKAWNWMGEHKGLLGGVAAGGVGLWALHRMLANKPKPRVSQPVPYYQGQLPQFTPQAFQKAGGLIPAFPSINPSGLAGAFDMMQGGGDAVTAQPQAPYNPSIETQDPRLKKALRDPRMREYIKQLMISSTPQQQ